MWPDVYLDKPKSVNVLGITIPVIYLSEMMKGDVVGEFNPSPLEIRVVDNEEWAYTLTHEVVHAALYISGYSQFMNRKLEEGVCRIVELTMRSVVENL